MFKEMLAGVIVTVFLLTSLQAEEAQGPRSKKDGEEWILARNNPEFKWIRNSTPMIPTVPGTWKSNYTANPDLLLIKDTYFLYYRGQKDDQHDRLGVMTVPAKDFDGKTWHEYAGNPVVDVGKAGSFDHQHALDPASVLVNGTVFLYYSAIGHNPRQSVGLAVSQDGFKFTKYKDNPVIVGRAPEVVHDGKLFYLYYVNGNRRGGYQINLAVSSDGYRFKNYENNPVLREGQGPLTPENWDGKTVTTPRIFKEKNTYYMIYAGDHLRIDSPRSFGLATSTDLYNWKKYPGNPIFSASDKKEWDGGYIWFGTVENINGVYYMWYEGAGEGSPSQTGLATMKSKYFFVRPH